MRNSGIRAFYKNLIRDIKKTLSRFLSIVIIIAVGVAFYAGVRATSPDMKMSGDLYFSKNNLMDYRIISTLGLTEEDVSELGKIPGITEVEGAYTLDAVIDREGVSQVLNINSLPQRGGINEIKLMTGKTPESIDEAVVEDRFFNSQKLRLGDMILLKSGGEARLEDRLNTSSFKIVGTAKSPLYISGQRQLSSVGNGNVRGFIYIPPKAFKDEAYSEVYIRVLSYESQNSLLNNEKYNSAMKAIEEALKAAGSIRGEIRYAEVVEKGAESLNEAEEELSKGRREAVKKFEEARRQLNEGRAKIQRGWKEIRDKEKLFNQGMAKGEAEIEEGKRKLLAAETDISSRLKDIEAGKLELSEGGRSLDEAEKRLKLGKQQAAAGISSGVSKRVEEARIMYEENPYNLVYKFQYDAIKGMYDKYIMGKDFDSMYAGLKADNMLDEIKPFFDMEALKEEEEKLAAGREALLKNEKILQEGEKQLNSGRMELEAKKRELFTGEEKLGSKRLEGIKKLNEGKRELQEGERALDESAQRLMEEEIKANKKLEEAEAKILENRVKLNEIQKPEWYVLGRAANVGYETYRQDSDRINNIGKVFPLIFFLVAALVSLTTMTRMVQDKRIEIGTFKAIGYSSRTVVSHYLIYALSASILGSLIGITLGFRLFPPLIINAYSSLYSIPYRVAPFNTNIALQASLVAVLFVAASAALSAMDELREVPASLMRPKPPKSGKRIFFERMTFVWKRLGFTEKVTARNIFRYKQRLFMTVIGIAACTALMITGFGLREGITGATENQFSRIYKYDIQATLEKNVGEAESNYIRQRAKLDTNIKSLLFSYSRNASVNLDDSREQDAYLIVPEDKYAIREYISLIINGREIGLSDDGVIFTEKLARMADKKVGDTVEINVNDRVMEARVSGITEHYIQHYIYISPAYYESLMGEVPSYNSFYGMLNNTSGESQESTSQKLKSIDNINSVSFKNNISIDYGESMKSVNSVVFILIISAGVLAFVVIYNLTNINIAERRRELATIKLLGFYNNELAAYVYRENTLLTIVGSLAGIFLGIGLNRYILLSAETNVIMFMNRIGLIYFFYSVLLTIIFSMIVNLAMYKRFDRIDMIESLKSVE